MPKLKITSYPAELDTPRMRIQRRIYQFRKALGVTQPEFAHLARLATPSEASRWENPESTTPKGFEGPRERLLDLGGCFRGSPEQIFSRYERLVGSVGKKTTGSLFEQCSPLERHRHDVADWVRAIFDDGPAAQENWKRLLEDCPCFLSEASWRRSELLAGHDSANFPAYYSPSVRELKNDLDVHGESYVEALQKRWADPQWARAGAEHSSARVIGSLMLSTIAGSGGPSPGELSALGTSLAQNGDAAPDWDQDRSEMVGARWGEDPYGLWLPGMDLLSKVFQLCDNGSGLDGEKLKYVAEACSAFLAVREKRLQDVANEHAAVEASHASVGAQIRKEPLDAKKA